MCSVLTRAVLDVEAERSSHWLGRAGGYSKNTDVAAMTAAVMLTQAPPGVRLQVGLHLSQ